MLNKNLLLYSFFVWTYFQFVSNVSQFSESQLETDYESDVSDFLVWSSIASSLAKWSDTKKAKNRRKLEQNIVKNGIHRRNRRRRDEEIVCYRNFGCFRDEGPFDYLDTLPASPEAISTTFTLYTRKSSIEGEKLDYENSSSLLMSHFNSSHPIKIIIHGFGSSGKRPWVLQMTEALLFMDDINVIVVDWENGATLPNYVQAAANTQLIGKQIASLIRMINFNKDIAPKDYHLIGFSLGAHVAGFTGMEINNISRITGLDPAAPLFEGYPSRVRLDPSDANFVDVIHSNGDSFLRGGLGSFAPMGHVDFYPNGGRVQVGCNSVFMGALSDIIYGQWNSLCNHRRAFRFFIDSVIRTCTFRAFSCDTYEDYLRGECFECGKDGTKCSNMGYFAHNSNGRGKMYLVTREKEPFCANQYKIRVTSSSGQGSTWGKLEIQFIGKDDMNETFTLTNEADEIKDVGLIQGLVVAHPIIRNVTNVILTYTKYKGWIYSGKESWNIDKIELINSDGDIASYCGHSTKLDNSNALQLSLTNGNCSVNLQTITPMTATQPQRIAKLFWQVIGEPIKGTNPKPPKLFWKILINEQINSFEDSFDAEKYFWFPLI